MRGLVWLRIGLLWVKLTSKGKSITEVTAFHMYLSDVLAVMGWGGEGNPNPKHPWVAVILRSMVIEIHQTKTCLQVHLYKLTKIICKSSSAI